MYEYICVCAYIYICLDVARDIWKYCVCSHAEIYEQLKCQKVLVQARKYYALSNKMSTRACECMCVCIYM
jgi:hypothetical protein